MRKSRARILVFAAASLSPLPTDFALAEPVFEVVESLEEGSGPRSGLVLAPDGALYGTTRNGGLFDTGTVFKIDGAGIVSIVHTFGAPDAARSPRSPLAVGPDGALYGTTGSGGSIDLGTVFRMDATGNLTLLHSFTRDQDNGLDPALPPLVLGSDRALYGFTNGGGSSRAGTAYRVDDTGTFSLLHSFDVRPAILFPPVVASDGVLYGTTGRGGSSDSGTVFKVNGAAVTTLHSFSGSEDGGEPGGLAAGADGGLYGATVSGGLLGLGNVFRIDGGGTLTTLHSFSGPDGALPVTALVVGGDRAFYGTTAAGGGPSDSGTVFRIDSAGSFTSLHSFNRADGEAPTTTLTNGSDGALYGTTEGGGAFGRGTVFRIDATGTFTSLHSFSGADGLRPDPYVPLALGSDCALYGTTPAVSISKVLFPSVLYRVYESGQLCQTVRFDPLADRTLGEPPFFVSATASSGLDVSFRGAGSCAVDGDQLTITGGGTCVVTASQPGDSSYQPATDVSQAFNVFYRFTGFLPPVRNPPAINWLEAGSAVPLRWKLGDHPGPGVVAEGYPVVREARCDSFEAIGEAEPATTPGLRWLGHSWRSGLYTYIWKTDRRWAGTCREFTLRLVDGTIHQAHFRFRGRHAFRLHPVAERSW